MTNGYIINNKSLYYGVQKNTIIAKIILDEPFDLQIILHENVL